MLTTPSLRWFALSVAITFWTTAASQAQNSPQQFLAKSNQHDALLWSEPTDIASRNLLYGSGGIEHKPDSRVFFVEEDQEGSSPKLNVREASGAEWKVKFGIEAKPETVAAHLLWAVGFCSDEDYLIPELTVEGMPTRLKRGHQFLTPDGRIQTARLERKVDGQKKQGFWKWKRNPFNDTREFNGLRVMMALMNNWDLKDVNTAVYVNSKQGDTVYCVSDLGATFGTTNYSWSDRVSKGNLRKYQKSKFITKVTPEYVDLAAPGRRPLLYVFSVPSFFKRLSYRWIGRRIPRKDAKWMGEWLSRLSPQQIRAAFTSAGYTPGEAEAFATVVELRIADLNKL